MGLAVNAPDVLLVALGHQVVVNLKPYFVRNDHLWHAQEHVEGVSDTAISGIFHGYHAKIDVAALNFFKNGANASHGHEINRLAKTLNSSKVAERELWPQIGNLQHFLQGARPRHDFAEYRANGTGIERATLFLMQREDVFEDFLFTHR